MKDEKPKTERFVCHSTQHGMSDEEWSQRCIEIKWTDESGSKPVCTIANFRTGERLAYQFEGTDMLEMFCCEVLHYLGVEVPGPPGIPRLLPHHLDRFVTDEEE